MKLNEKILEKVKDIQDQINNINNIDMDNLIDLKHAKESLKVIKSDINKMITESPFYGKILELTAKFLNLNINDEIEKWENLISKKIEELSKSKTCKCCDSKCCEIDDDDDFDYKYINDYPVTGKELIEDYIDEELIDSSNGNVETFANLIAKYINDNHNYISRVEENDMIEYISNILFEFINYTMEQ